MKIALAGGTGLVGKFAVTAAENRGHEVVSISRRNGIDLISGEGLVEALGGVDVVIDVTNKTECQSCTKVLFNCHRQPLKRRSADRGETPRGFIDRRYR
ncbi:MAG: hypothetical protein RL044_477 [Actinomycetota bacterium]